MCVRYTVDRKSRPSQRFLDRVLLVVEENVVVVNLTAIIV